MSKLNVNLTQKKLSVNINKTGPKGDEGEINPDNYDAKASLNDSDKITGFDSESSDNPVTWLWSVIKSTFATYYNSLTATLTNKTLTALSNTIYADQVHVNADNETGTTIAKGSPVYASGYNVGQEEVEITLADASDDNKMPAIGITFEEISSGSTGAVAREGIIEGLDTSSYSVGDVLYVSETAGELTSTKPSASGSDVQPIAIVTRSNPGNGVIQVIAVDAYKITPTADGDIASKKYSDSGEQTLTNKTIDANNNTFSWGSSVKTTEDDSKAIIQKSDGTSETIRWDDLKSNMNDWQSSPGYRKLWQKIYNIGTDSGDKTIRLLQIGDSVSADVISPIADVINNSYGIHTKNDYGLGGDGSINLDALLYTAEGSAQKFTKSDWSISISGSYYRMDAATNDAFRVYENSGLLKGANTIKVYYVKESGAGSFKIQTSTTAVDSGFSDETGFTNIDCDNSGSEELGIATISKASDGYAVRLEALSGVVKIIGVGMYDDSKPDGYYWNTNQGSLNPANFDANSQVIVDFINDYDPDIITYFTAERDAQDHSDGLDALYTWIDNSTIEPPSVLCIAPYSGDGEDVRLNESRKKVIEKAIEYNWMWFDAFRSSGGSYQAAVDLGWGGDGVHYSNVADRYFAHQIIRNIGLPESRYSKTYRKLDLSRLSDSTQNYLRRLDFTNDSEDDPASTITIENTNNDLRYDLKNDLKIYNDLGNIIASFDGSQVRFGVGTQTPSEALEVVGNALVQAASGNTDFTVKGGDSGQANFTFEDGSGNNSYSALVNPSGVYLTQSGGGAGLNIRVRGGDFTIYTTTSNTERLRIKKSNGYVGVGSNSPDTRLHVNGAITQQPLSSDPADPDDGNSVQWVSDGTGSGDAGDVMMKINVGGTVKTITLVDFSAL